jgi:hypothetical protein
LSHQIQISESISKAVLGQLGGTTPAALARSVQKLSDFYIANPAAPTPYDESWAREAYLAYFFPLNLIRLLAATERAKQTGFFSGLNSWIDFGSGPGPASLALDLSLPGQFTRGLCIERSAQSIRMHERLRAANAGIPQTPKVTWQQSWGKGRGEGLDAKTTLAVFSYSLTEIDTLPPWVNDHEAVMIVEPATNQDGRKLLELRRSLMGNGWKIWGPCTHQASCPLLDKSNRDWCHDRTDWIKPSWFEDIQKHLPMRNDTLTWSWLIARRTPPPASLSTLARLTGDLRKEKGAARQMFCRGEDREFLSWQKRDGESPEWPRGALVRLAPGVVQKGSEIRPKGGEIDLVEGPVSL